MKNIALYLNVEGYIISDLENVIKISVVRPACRSAKRERLAEM